MSELEDWLNSLISDGILVESEEPKLSDGTVPYVLSAPIRVSISAQAADRLRRRYRQDREIGGILLAEPSVDQDGKNLVVNGVRFIRNLSDEPKTKYLAVNRLNHMHRCLIGTKSGKHHYLPIWFHSHPIRHLTISEAVMSYFEMQNSSPDVKLATNGIEYEPLGRSLFLPSALMLVTDDGGLFIGIYGGYVAPDDLRQAAFEILGEKALDLATAAWDWGFDEGASNWRKLGGALGAIGAVVAFAFTGAGLASNDPKLVAQINRFATSLQESAGEKRYIGISKQGGLCLTIPKEGSGSSNTMTI